MKLFNVIAQETNGHELTGEINYVGKHLTLTNAKKQASRIWKEIDTGKSKYGLCAIEENEYSKNPWSGKYEDFEERIASYHQLTNGEWERS